MQILAWNGGGSSNYSGIINEGGYTTGQGKPKSSGNMRYVNIEELEQELEMASHNIIHGASVMTEKAEKVSEKIEDFVSEELKGFFDEMRE